MSTRINNGEQISDPEERTMKTIPLEKQIETKVKK